MIYILQKASYIRVAKHKCFGGFKLSLQHQAHGAVMKGGLLEKRLKHILPLKLGKEIYQKHEPRIFKSINEYRTE